MKNVSLNAWYRASLGMAGALLLHACAPGQDQPTPTTGIDASRYVAVGDSYTAGLSAGGVTLASQQYAYPNLLAQQLGRANANATFTQPLFEAGSGSGYLSLVDLPATGLPRVRRVPGQAVLRAVINPTACGGPDTVRLLTRSASSASLPQNLGVPGLQLGQLETAGLGNATNATPGGAFNPYFERLLPAADSRTYLQTITAASSSATFFTYFIGLDDLLPFVRSGGQCGGLDDDSPAKRNLLSSTMRQNAKKILDVLAAGGRPGIIARLPSLTNLPLLRLGRGIELQGRLQSAANDTAKVYIQAPFPTFALPPRAITNEDYVLANAISRLGKLTSVVIGTTTLMLPYGRDIRNPVRDEDVLDSRELSFAAGILNNYNTELERLATEVYKQPVISASDTKRTLDTNIAFPNYVGESISVAGVVYSAEPVRGNFFSLDYYSLTPRGNALLANAFITAINRAYKANIPAIDANSLPTAAQ
jgi:hypothetical protein